MLNINEIKNMKENIKSLEMVTFTTEGLAMFLAQCDHETMGFKQRVENFFYNAAGLLKVFPAYFDQEKAEKYAYQPQLIANYVYANRMGNGSAESGDGYKYRGRGNIHITGKGEYIRCEKDLCLPLEDKPEMLEYPAHALRSALWFFKNRKIVNNINCQQVTLKVNGGLKTLKDREGLFEHYKRILLR